MFNEPMPTISGGKLDEYPPLTKKELKDIERTRKKIQKIIETKKLEFKLKL